MPPMGMWQGPGLPCAWGPLGTFADLRCPWLPGVTLTFSSWFNPVWAKGVSLEQESRARGWLLPLPSPARVPVEPGLLPGCCPAQLGCRAVGGGWFWQPNPGGPGAHPGLRAAALSGGAVQLPTGVGGKVGCTGEQQGQGTHGAARSGGLGVPPASEGACNIGQPATVFPSQAQQRQRRGVWATVWWPTGGCGCNCAAWFSPSRLCQAGRGPGSPGVPRRAGNAGCGKQLGASLPAAGSSPGR